MNFRMPACQKSDDRYSEGMPESVKPPAARDTRKNDAATIDLFRKSEPLGIGELSKALGVTATAVRQRLERLMSAGLVERSTVSRPRGRPAHAYRLTTAGQKMGGDNFRDLAITLWREVRSVRDPSTRSGLLRRIGTALAATYRDRIKGSDTAERLESVAALFRERDICCSVDLAAGDERLPVLTSHSCPYPDLADEDRGICAAERLMLQELLGADVRLAECRLDGDKTCRFVVAEQGVAGVPPALAPPAVNASNTCRLND